MRVFGIDFTSAPCARKPVTCALANLDGGRLILHGLCALDSLDCFENLLRCDGPWIAGMDFPFGLPRDFLEPANWPTAWERYVETAAGMERQDFHDMMREICNARPEGQRYSLREADRAAGARSPMNVTRPPVGLMFHAGAPSLLASGATVVPVHRGDPDRTVVEAYPKLVAEALIGRRPYKDEKAAEPGEPRTEARSELVRALASARVAEIYGVRVEDLGAFEEDLCQDVRGDRVDAVMCAVQAAWAWNNRHQDFGIPGDVDPAEGWITDPATAAAATA